MSRTSESSPRHSRSKAHKGLLFCSATWTACFSLFHPTLPERARARAVAVLRYTKKRTWQAGRRRAAERRGAAFGQAAAAGAPRALPTPQQEKQKEKIPNLGSRSRISNLANVSTSLMIFLILINSPTSGNNPEFPAILTQLKSR